MRTILEDNDIKYLEERGIYFIYVGNKKFTAENSFMLSNDGEIIIDKDRLNIHHGSHTIEPSMISNRTRCFEISSPDFKFNEGRLIISFKEYTYEEILTLLNREYSFNKLDVG